MISSIAPLPSSAPELSMSNRPPTAAVARPTGPPASAVKAPPIWPPNELASPETVPLIPPTARSNGSDCALIATNNSASLKIEVNLYILAPADWPWPH